MDFSTVLTSSVLAGLVAASVALRTSERKIQIENITQERAKWRKSIRELSDEIVQAASGTDQGLLERLCAKLTLNLNPFHGEDIQIVKSARELIISANRTAAIQEYVQRVSLLLKHDWDRAKYEAKPRLFRGNEPRRVLFCEFGCEGHGQTFQRNHDHSTPALAVYFAMPAISAGILFFLAVGLAKPFEELVNIFNDSSVEKPIAAWGKFLGWSVLCGSMWSGAYLWFKGSEKKFLEIWFSR